MDGLQKELPKHLLCGWQKVRVDHYEEGTYDPICEWCMRQDNRKDIFVLERDDFDRRNYAHILKHDDFNHQIKVGSDCKDKATAPCVDSGSPTDNSDNKTEDGKKGTSDSNPPPDEKPLPVPELILLVGASMILMGNLGLFEDFYSQIPNRSPPAQRQRPSENSRNPNNRYRNRLSPETAKRIRDCLKANIEKIIGVPELDDLVKSLMNEDEYSISETQRQVRLLYKQVQQLYKTIADCDPSLIQELLAADQADEQEQFQEQPQFGCQNSVTIVGELVNVRARPSSYSEVIGQTLYGTCLQIDTETFAYLSEAQRQAIVAGEGWYPVILPNGMRGYIYSRYASRVPSLP